MNAAGDCLEPGVAARLAVSMIQFYQQQISPRKGFVCAHRELHRGESCSEFGVRVFSEVGACRALLLLKSRFQDCRAAANLLANRRFEEQLARDHESKRRRLEEIEGPYPHWFESCASWGGAPCVGLEIAACCGW